MIKAKRIVIHCSDSSFGNAALITKWHIERGWSNIGYHYVVLNGWINKNIFNASTEGNVETGRPLNDDEFICSDEIGAGAYGFNSDSIHVCIIGKNTFTAKQFESLIYLCRSLKKQFKDAEIVGHSELDEKKTCPNFSVQDFVNDNNILMEF